MRILRDGDVPIGLARHPVGHEADSVNRIGWKSKTNGELLHDAVSAGYDVLLILDKAMPSQQSFARFDIAVILLHPRNNMKKLNDLVPLAPGLLSTVEAASKGQLTVIRD